MDISKVFDICVLFGHSSESLTRKMISSFMELLPFLEDELRMIAPEIVSSLRDTMNRINSKASKDKMAEFQTYLVDILATLSAFFSAYPKGCEAFPTTSQSDLLALLPPLYETIIPLLSPSTLAQRCCLSIANSLVEQNYFSKISNRALPDRQRQQLLDEVLDFFNSIPGMFPDTPEVTFLRDFGRKYFLQSRLDLLLNFVGLKADSSYLQSILLQLCGEFEPLERPSGRGNVPKTSGPSPARLSQISQVRDLFPDLGEGFIDAALKALGDSPERVVNSLLEGSLPPAIEALDRSMPLLQTTDLMASRESIYDNDEFDIMANDSFDRSKVHKKGVTDKDKLVKEILEDKSDILKMKDRYLEYQYEDEYDDSFDTFSGNLGVSDEMPMQDLVLPSEGREEEEQEGSPSNVRMPTGPAPNGTEGKKETKERRSFGRGRGIETSDKKTTPGIGRGYKSQRATTSYRKDRARAKRNFP